MARRFQPPLSRRHQRFRTYSVAFVAFFAIAYLLSRPIDDLAIDFFSHERWMNDRVPLNNFVPKESFDWRKVPFNNTPESFISLPTSAPKALPRIQYQFPPESSSQKSLREKRRVIVRNEFLRSWNSYKTVAWTRDELAPISNKGVDTFGGWGATLVDALDTLWIMGLKDEFYEAVAAVAQIDFGTSRDHAISVFETTIRYLGGLLSAYDLSGEEVLLEKAIQVGEMLYRAFDTGTHMPMDRLTIEYAKTGAGFEPDASLCFAALASLSMEFVRLAQITEENKFYDAVARVTQFLGENQNQTRIPGLFPMFMNPTTMHITYDRTFTLGAMEDSSYEYFPKTFALLGGLEPLYEKLYKNAAVMIDKHMLFRPMLPDGDDILIAGDVHANDPESVQLEPEGQHLTCFVGGFFALAGRLFRNEHHVDLGAKLTKGCIYAYASMPTGIMPEIFNALPCPSRTECPWNQTAWEEQVLLKAAANGDEEKAEDIAEALKIPRGFTAVRDKRYLLRPEAIESVFIMYRITGREEYLEYAWDMFTSIRKWTSTSYGNGQVLDVTDTSSKAIVEDKMESFWLAETLKYFYLIFSPPDMISLDDFVLNTEAHPFRRPKLIEEGGRMSLH